ncbi:hypothetical protein Tco_1453665 [Tanacetum coccineum]
MVCKYVLLSMVESEKKGKAKLMVESEKGKAKLMVSDEMVELNMRKTEHDKGKAKQAEHDLDDVDPVDALDLENRIKKLKEDFNMLLKAKKAKEANEAEKAELKVNKEVVQVSSDEGYSGYEDVVCFNDVKYPLIDDEIMMYKETPTTSRGPRRQLASTSTRSRALIASTSSA